VGDLVQRPIDGVRISVDGRVVASETTVTSAGPSVLVLITALGELGITVTSTYIGHDGTDSLAAHLVVSRRTEELDHLEHSREALPVTHARGRCLLDHAAHVQEAVGQEAGAVVAVDVDPAALMRAAFV
jgi:hypothetical protein